MTLPGPSRTIIVQPIEQPAPPERVPDAEPEREREDEPVPPEREPEHDPDREPVKVP